MKVLGSGLLLLLWTAAAGCGLGQLGKMQHGLRAEAGYWRPEVDMKIAVSGASLPGTVVDYQGTLGMPGSDNAVYLTLNTGLAASRFIFNWFLMEMNGVADVAVPFNFAGDTFGGGLNPTVVTNFEMNSFGIIYERRVPFLPSVDASLRAGFQIFDTSISIVNGPRSAAYESLAYVPVLGGSLSWTPVRNLTVFAELTAVSVDTSAISLSIDSDFDGDLIDLWTGVRYQWNQFFFSAGYRRVQINADIESLSGRMVFDGLILGGGAMF